MGAQNLFAPLRKKREQKQREDARQQKQAALSHAAIVKRQKLKEKREDERTRQLKLEAEEAKLQASQHRAMRELEAKNAQKTNEDSILQARTALVEVQSQTTNGSSPNAKPSRKRPAVDFKLHFSETASTTASTAAPQGPTVKELLDKLSPNVMPIPDEETVTSLSTMRVLYADAEHGIGLWGESSGRWVRPNGWWHVIESLNQAYTKHGKHDPDIMCGEYNAVFIDCVEKYCSWLPDLKTPSGDKLSCDDLVFRITRPDVEHDGSATAHCRHRYKTLREQADELYYTLHGAANGYALPVIAAMIFEGPRVRRRDKNIQLYGSLYVLKKAPVTLTNILEDHTKHIALSKGMSVDSDELTPHLMRGARKVAAKVLPVLVKQARLGCLYFDCKPSNMLFVEGANVYLSDFDAAMYGIMKTDDSCWEAHLMISLLLLGTHIRCYQFTGIANGWAVAVRTLMLDLAVSARAAKWLFDARVTERAFIPTRVKTGVDASNRLEMMTSAYFCDKRRTKYFKNDPRFACGANAPPLVSQMLKFVLTGSSVSFDTEICTALGEKA